MTALPAGQEALEAAVMGWFAQVFDPASEGALSEQLAVGRISGRSFTGVGFYADYEVSTTTKKMFDGLTGVAFWESCGVRFFNQEVATFMLGFDDGRLSHLEGQMLDTDVWPSDVSSFQVI